jgi:PAS domain S-box-containing protein
VITPIIIRRRRLIRRIRTTATNSATEKRAKMAIKTPQLMSLAALLSCLTVAALSTLHYLVGMGSLERAVGTSRIEKFAAQQKLCSELAGELAAATALLGLCFSALKRGAAAQASLENMTRRLDATVKLIPEGLTSSQFGAAHPLDGLTELELAVNMMRLELGELRRREKLLIDRAVDVICVVDIDARFVSMNNACLKAWGYESSELLGADLRTILPSSQAEWVVNQILAGSKSIAKVVFESQVLRKDGSLIDVIWTGHWSAREGGLFCIVHDISPQKLVEKAIRQSEQTLRMMLESLPAAVFVSNREGGIEFANHAACQLLGYEESELLGLTSCHVFPGGVADWQPSAGPLPVGVSAVKKDGTAVAVGLSRSPLDLSDGQRVLSVFLDRTAEQELERTKREFLAMITHDLRSPLTANLGALSLLEEGICGVLNPLGARLIGGTRKEMNRVLRLLNDMLQVASIDAGSFDLQVCEFDLCATVMDAVENVHASAEAQGVSIRVVAGRTVCFADEQRIMQVLINLLSNAIKYSPAQSSIKVSLKSENDFAFVSVEDQGRGIPAEKLSQIFEKFQQVERSDSREKGGFGLGLAICKAIVEKHCGKIGVESEVGQGSTFWFCVPLSAAAYALSGEPPAQTASS